MILFLMMNPKEASMDTPYINHRRDRQHIRRYLAAICIRGRDLTGSVFRTELDLLDGHPRLCVFRRLGIERNQR